MSKTVLLDKNNLSAFTEHYSTDCCSVKFESIMNMSEYLMWCMTVSMLAMRVGRSGLDTCAGPNSEHVIKDYHVFFYACAELPETVTASQCLHSVQSSW